MEVQGMKKTQLIRGFCLKVTFEEDSFRDSLTLGQAVQKIDRVLSHIFP